MVDAIQKAEQRSPGDGLADSEEMDQTRVYVCDINPNMLEVGKQRAKERGDDFTLPNFRVAKSCPFAYCLSWIIQHLLMHSINRVGNSTIKLTCVLC